MALAAGSLAYLDYGEHPRCVHVRLILGHVTGNEYVVLAPDHDVYSEVLDWVGAGNGAIPAGVPRRAVYGFAPLIAAEVARFMRVGNAEAC